MVRVDPHLKDRAWDIVLFPRKSDTAAVDQMVSGGNTGVFGKIDGGSDSQNGSSFFEEAEEMRDGIFGCHGSDSVPEFLRDIGGIRASTASTSEL